MLKRLDVLLVERGLAKSRERAKGIILSGGVVRNGKVLKKPSVIIEETEELTVSADPLSYVGRGGLKLEKAVEVFGISLEGKICLDIGASTGGFTQCMLQNGGEKVYAVDVGHDQLDASLRENPKVVSMEGTDARSLEKKQFPLGIGFISADVSFISLKMILPVLERLLQDGGEFVVLVKPQFEAGKADIGKKGVVKSKKVHMRILREITAECTLYSLAAKGLSFSPVCGGEGNIEYLLYGSKGGAGTVLDIEPVVSEAFRLLKGKE